MAVRWIGAVLVALILAGSQPALGQGRTQTAADEQANNDLEKFLFASTQRQAFSQGNQKAQQANDFLERFPPWAQQELLEIVMMIMRESGEGAMKHGTAYQAGGHGAAMGSFSPAVKAKIRALSQKLNADKKFDAKKMQQHAPKP